MPYTKSLPRVMGHYLAMPLLCASMLTACGGGGGGSSSATPTPTPSPSPTPTPTPTLPPTQFEAGTYEPHVDFWQICETPRTGNNPQTDEPYFDIQGTTAHENHWVRSYTNDTYLWYNESPDLDPNDHDDTREYFELMLSSDITPSGKLKDQFSGSLDTEDFYNFAFSGENVGYGIDSVNYFSGPGFIVQIRFVEPDSPAAIAELRRGDIISRVNGDLLTQSITEEQFYNVFPIEAELTNTLTIQRSGVAEFDVTITSAVLEDAPVHIARTLDIGEDKVGYLMLNTFGSTSAEAPLIDAMTTFETQGIDDLVLDLRYNGGGFLNLSSMLAYMVAGDAATDGKTYELSAFNDKHSVTDPISGGVIEPILFLSTSTFDGNNTPLPQLNLSRLFVLTDEGTCSASEALINGLRGIDIEVIQIGDITCGKPYGFYIIDNCGTSYAPVQFRSLNAKGFSDYADGFTPSEIASSIDAAIPGCFAADDFSSQLGELDEPKLSKALTYRQHGSCDVDTLSKTDPAAKILAGRSKVSQADMNAAQALIERYDDKTAARNFVRKNRIIGTEAP